jgi:CRP/FNR family transcriptional regulator
MNAMESPEKQFERIFGGQFFGEERPAQEICKVMAGIIFRALEEGTIILREGDSCSAVPFVMSGSIRVFKAAENGREITLYRIEAGQSCILSSGCASAITVFPATAVVEMPTAAAFMPAPAVRFMLEKHAGFRGFVLAQYARRMAGIIELVEEVAFRRVDQRLKEWLLGRCRMAGAERLVVTHQELADHIGTSREVISRILKDWELRGALELSRGEIRLLPSFSSLSV